MIYLDSNVFLYPLIYEESLEEVKKADRYLNQLVKGKMDGCTSVLTWDEVFYVVFRVSRNIEEARLAGERFLRFPNLKFISADFYLITKAQKIASEFGIKPRDGIHAACALEYCDGEIISNDSDFDDIEGIKRRF